MHQAMEIVPIRNIDRDFMQMMIPHHQGAIDMALVLLKHGRDERLKRLAQSIIIEQGQEIAYMRTLLDAPRAEPSAAHRIVVPAMRPFNIYGRVGSVDASASTSAAAISERMAWAGSRVLLVAALGDPQTAAPGTGTPHGAADGRLDRLNVSGRSQNLNI
jgi:hypothetical protein